MISQATKDLLLALLQEERQFPHRSAEELDAAEREVRALPTTLEQHSKEG